MADLSIRERAELIADEFGIAPASFAGRDTDAVIAMTLLKAAKQGGAGAATGLPSDRNAILKKIYIDMDFQTTNPLFCREIHNAMADIIANPVWRPGSLSNEWLFSELKFWRNVSYILEKAGFVGVPGAISADAKASGRAMQEAFTKPDTTLRSVGAAGVRPFRPTSTSGVLVFGVTARTISDASVGDLETELKRRNLLGDVDARDNLNNARP